MQCNECGAGYRRAHAARERAREQQRRHNGSAKLREAVLKRDAQPEHA
jgi:hypothetical protein